MAENAHEERTCTVQFKLTQAALERLVGKDPALEVILGHQVVENLIQKNADLALSKLDEAISQGFDSRGFRILPGVLEDALKSKVRSLVDEYLRLPLYGGMVRSLVEEQLKEQLPGVVKSAVRDALKKATDSVMKELKSE